MNKLKKALVTFGVAATLAVTGGAVADVATAHNTSKAEALTWSSPWKHQSGGYWCPVFMRVTSVNFWDWMAGYREGQIHLQYYARC